ncbi:MAG: ABC transporter ATP-binding protein [Acidobacteria bacterium]|nr:ABC transporter ATP-binding protein [Acidobacteriota bacterium]
MPMVQIDKLVKEYDGLLAVDNLDLELETGVVLGLVGPNGAGKTTTLRCLSGIIPPTSGRILVDGNDLEKERVPARQVLAFVPDEPRLFEDLTVRDHLAVIARLYGVADGRQRGAELLARFDLSDREDSYPSELSRGMKQKLMIALALLHRPRLLILDEPLTGLDPAAMRRMKRTLQEMAREGMAVMVSSHMLHLVEEICDDILILQKGRKIVEGSLAEIRARLPELDASADLEEIFMHATGGDDLP